MKGFQSLLEKEGLREMTSVEQFILCFQWMSSRNVFRISVSLLQMMKSTKYTETTMLIRLDTFQWRSSTLTFNVGKIIIRRKMQN
jgi:hypothetical protein